MRHGLSALTRLLLVGITVFMSSASARQPLDLPACGANIHPVQCYASSSALAAMLCELEAQTAVAKMQLGRITHADMLSKANDCVKRNREKIDPRYEAALHALFGNKEGANVLKDHHAFWIGTLDTIHPRSDETERAYKKRLADRQAALRDKRNRLLLER